MAQSVKYPIGDDDMTHAYITKIISILLHTNQIKFFFCFNKIRSIKSRWLLKQYQMPIYIKSNWELQHISSFKKKRRENMIDLIYKLIT